MTTKTTDRTTSADLAARLRERAAEYEEAGREKLRAESALLAAMANYERARYRLDRDDDDFRARVKAWSARHGKSVLGAANGCMVWLNADEQSAYGLCGKLSEAKGLPDVRHAMRADCPACLAALDEVQA
jgi:hypothetical protein